MHNTKIVIITNLNGGIQKILKEKNNLHSEFSLKYLFNQIQGRNSISYEPKTDFLYISKNKISQEKFNDWEVVLVADSIDVYPEFIFDNSLVMYHSRPSNIEIILSENLKIKSKKRGYHEIGESYGYFLLNYLIKAYSPENDGFIKSGFEKAIKIIVDWFNINDELEDRLNFLHKCLCPESIPKPDNNIDKLLGDHREEFEVFYEKRESRKWNDVDYIEDLKNVRSKLLQS